MNRRDFFSLTTGTALTAVMPATVFATPQIKAKATPLKWFAVGHNDEFCEPIRATSIKDACREYAIYSGHTKGEECPECGEYECRKHLTEAQWFEPQDCIAENCSQPKAWEDLEHEPTGVDWLKAGFHTHCEGAGCETRSAYWETTECWAFEGKALCEDCLAKAQPDPTRPLRSPTNPEVSQP